MNSISGKKDEKLFKDPVHGYIPIPDTFCKKFIDHPIFQRLRHIEQTSMRPLYPGAHHDRFIHSLGVYHLGRQVSSGIQLQEAGLSPSDEKLIKTTFVIACLMHDCGHSPFSHTCEEYYNYSDTAEAGKKAEELLKQLADDQFRNDFKIASLNPAPHETFSAALLIDIFGKEIAASGADAILAARMITGCRFESPDSDKECIANCFIDLLNGTAIDLDKLDYIIRDTWASGVKNTAIDVERLIGSINIRKIKQSYRLCFHRSALSVLRSVVDARNFLYEWIYNHHTVVYYANLLKSALQQLSVDYSIDGNPDHFWNSVFSIAPFKAPVPLAEHAVIYLPTDGDLLYLLKSKAKTDKYRMVNEILSHKPSRIALWKTYGEFKVLLDEYTIQQNRITDSRRTQIPERLAAFCGTEYNPDDFTVIKSESRHVCINSNDIMVDMRESGLISFTKIFGESTEYFQRFFYVFVPRVLESRIPELKQEVCHIFS